MDDSAKFAAILTLAAILLGCRSRQMPCARELRATKEWNQMQTSYDGEEDGLQMLSYAGKRAALSCYII